LSVPARLLLNGESKCCLAYDFNELPGTNGPTDKLGRHPGRPWTCVPRWATVERPSASIDGMTITTRMKAAGAERREGAVPMPSLYEVRLRKPPQSYRIILDNLALLCPAYILVEPLKGARPCLLGRGLVIAFRRRVIEEP